MKLNTPAKILETAKLGKVGKDIFKHNMPAEVQQGILLRDCYDGTEINHYLPGLFQTYFSLIVRHRDHEDGESLIERAVRAFGAVVETQYSDMYIRYMRPRGLPFNYPLSPSNVIEFIVTIDVAFNIV